MSGALCVGKWWLFDSTNPVDHMNARRLCTECPMLAECAAIAARCERGAGGAHLLTGTWAGKLYGRPKIGRWPCWRDSQAARRLEAGLS